MLSLVVLVFSLIFTILSRPLWVNTDVLVSRPTTPTGGLPRIDPLRVLLLTAHPDDECMFFAPTVLALTTHDIPALGSKPELFSLCLSIGDADGLGDIRRQELALSLEVLGIKAANRWTEDRP